MSLSIGNKEVKGLYVGNKKVLKAYYGANTEPFYNGNNSIEYLFSEGVLSITNAPHTLSNNELIIGE